MTARDSLSSAASTEAYRLAQRAMADLKASVHWVLASAGPDGYTNAQIGRSLGIYGGHVGHEGHISRTLLAMLAADGVAEQDGSTRRWRLRRNPASLESDSDE